MSFYRSVPSYSNSMLNFTNPLQFILLYLLQLSSAPAFSTFLYCSCFVFLFLSVLPVGFFSRFLPIHYFFTSNSVIINTTHFRSNTKQPTFCLYFSCRLLRSFLSHCLLYSLVVFTLVDENFPNYTTLYYSYFISSLHSTLHPTSTEIYPHTSLNHIP
jgi:hypothetical protein